MRNAASYRGLWLFAVVGLIVGLFAINAAAQGDTINACINPSGSVFVVDDLSECGTNDTPISWSTAGSGGSVSYYTSETVFASPPITTPGADVLAAGTEFNCDPGDVAVDFNHWSVQTDYVNGSQSGVSYGAGFEDPIVPDVDTAGSAPNGFVALRDIIVASEFFDDPMGGGTFGFTQVRHFMVTCADVAQ